MLGASSWRIEDITLDRVIVSPAPGEPGKMPFWKGDKPGRPIELGRAIGAFTRELRGVQARAPRSRSSRPTSGSTSAPPEPRRVPRRPGRGDRRRPRRPHRSWSSGSATSSATGGCASCRRSAQRVHAPWATRDRGAARRSVRARRAGAVERRRHRRSPARVRGPDPRRGPAVRSRRDRGGRRRGAPGHRDVRQRFPRGERSGAAAPPPAAGQAHPALAAAAAERRPARARPRSTRRSRCCSRPRGSACGTCSTCRPSARCMADLRSRRTKLVAVDTETASPFAQSLLFRWVSVYMYEGDAPLAERRAAALSLDRDLLRELLGTEELRELLDPRAIDEVELELQWLADGRHARSADGTCTTCFGDSGRSARTRSARGSRATCRRGSRASSRRAGRSGSRSAARTGSPPSRTRPPSGTRSAPRCRSACPVCSPSRRERPLERLVARYARTHGPFEGHEVAARLGAGEDRVRAAPRIARGRGPRRARRSSGRAASDREWCRRRRPAADPATVARGAPQGGRAGRRRDVRAVPAGVAGCRPAARRRRRA